jgi:GDP-L-fucose synthase
MSRRALLRKAHEAKLARREELVVWGTGSPRREFLHVDDLADACVFLMERGYDGPLLNVGTGEDLPIRELAALIMRVVGLEARLRFDASKPDGTPRKLLDVGRLRALGWRARTPLAEGIAPDLRAFPRGLRRNRAFGYRNYLIRL